MFQLCIYKAIVESLLVRLVVFNNSNSTNKDSTNDYYLWSIHLI